MSNTHLFDEAVNAIGSFINRSDDSLTLTANEAEKISKGLKKVVAKLPGETLKLSKASSKKGDTDKEWAFEGTPTTPELRIPGFPKMEFDLPKAKAVLKVTDGGVEAGKEKEPKFELTISSQVPVMQATIPVKLTITEKDEQTLAFGDAKKAPLEADLVALAESSNWSEASNELLRVAGLVRLRAARLHVAVFKVVVAREDSKINSFSIQGGLTFGPVTLTLTIGAKRSTDGEFDREGFEVKAAVGAAGGAFRLGEILNDATGVTFLPKELDPELKSLSLARVYIPKNKRMNDMDTQRIVFQSPAESKKPELLITSAFDNAEKKFFALRIGWPKLDVVSIPLIGDQVQMLFEPLLVVATNKTLKMEWATSLFDLDAFPGLETMGVPKAKVKDAEVRKGFHCTGILKVGELLKVAYHFPVRVSKKEEDDLPFDAPSLEEPEAATPVPVERKVKAVKLQGIAFKYEKSAVSLIVDAEVETRGLTISPMGMRVSYALQEPKSGSRFSGGIDGGVVRFKKGELSLAGGFIRDDSGKGAPDWIGTGLVQYGKNFSLAAAFGFRHDKETSLFLFAYVRRQLGGPAWCYVTGLAGGFGYNRAFTIPTVDKVNSFGLVTMANKLSRGEKGAVPEKMDGPALREIVSSLKGIKPEAGSNFGTVGITFTTFGLMNSTVLLTVMFGNRLEFSLLGSSSINVPEKAPAAHADVQLVAAVKPDDGIFSLDAVLGPNSYVLAKACRLTGGFALYTWFSGEHAKDFVICLGGYHPAYKKPKHYPLVPRLGFLWKISSVMRVAGFAYMALTPKNIQLGGGLDLLYDLNALKAWMHVEAHFLIAWDPFFYDVALKVEIGISFRMDLLFCSVTLSLDISADLHLWGPDFSGRAEVHLWFATFSFNFGAHAENKEPALEWDGFVSAFLTPAPPKPKHTPLSLVAEPEPLPLPLDIVAVGGLSIAPAGLRIEGKDFHGKQIDWIADPQQVELKIASTIPAETAFFHDDMRGKAEKIYAHPLKDTPRIEPELKVKLTKAKVPTLLREKPFAVQADAHASAVPAALWGSKVEKGTELSGGNETIQGITHMSLVPIRFEPSQTLPVAVNVLLFSRIETAERTWHRVEIPTKKFAWETSNPIVTIASQPVVARRKAILDALSGIGLVPADAAQSVDVRNVKEGQPCFMERPILGSLGTANTTV